MKRIIFFLLFIAIGYLSGVEPSLKVKKEYVDLFHDAFILQSNGHSTQAFFTFQAAFDKGTTAGESVKKLQAVADLFYWYRKFGNYLNLYSKKPIGNQSIKDEYRPKNQSHDFSIMNLNADNIYQSEYGKDPKQALLIRDFLLGIGEIVGGIFGVFAGSPTVKCAGAWMIGDGVVRIINNCNLMYYEYEAALFEFRKIEEKAQKAATN